jgi:hypothetical protein
MLNLTDNSHNGNNLLIGPWQQGLAGAKKSMLVRLGADKLHSGGADIPRGKVWTSGWTRVSDAYLVFFLAHVRETSDFGGLGLKW